MMADEMDENRPETRIEERDPENCIRIMLATDCHIGVHERDPIRGQDSINTFREVLQLAVKHEVDMVLLAGDLFHENRPSRETLYQTISLLREHVMSDKPVQIELLSDPDEGGVGNGAFPAINYEDPNLNVGIPVFSIHGNHDDPQGAGGPKGALCALDLLSVTGLVNYIGKMDLPDDENEGATAADGMRIVIRPVLLKKGDTKLAMYGVGNVKDQRMHYQLRSSKVKMFTPKDKDDWFNIMLLHQNRVKRGAIECVPEGMFDNSIDLIVWGHEHDCRIEPEPVAGRRYYISQPGSTVATSLAEGESLTKHVALLEIQGKSFQINPIVLQTVRPFKIDTISLAAVADEEEININDRMAINGILKKKINEMIVEAKKEYLERVGEEGNASAPMLPLIRLKVDTTGISDMTNPQRLGLEFQGKIANPRDVLQFTRAKARNAKNAITEPELEIDNLNLGPKEKVEKVRMGKLVQDYLSVQEMQLLGADAMNDAIETYVDKEDTHAISNFVKHSEKELRKEVPTGNEMDEADLENALANAREIYEREYKKEQGDKPAKKKKVKEEDEEEMKEQDAASVDSMELDDDEVPAKSKSKATAASTSTRRAATRATPVPAAKPAAKSAAKAKPAAKVKPAAKGKGKKKAVVDSDEEEDVEDFEDAIMDIDDSEESEEVPAPKKGKGRAAPAKPAPRATPAASAKPARGKKATQTTISFAPARGKAANRTIDLSDSE